MGAERTRTETDTNISQQAFATGDEAKINKLDLGFREAGQEGLIGTQDQTFNIISQLLGGGDLPGFLQGLPGGISSEAIGNQATQLAKQNLTGFNQLGLEDSGVAFRETAKDIGSNLLFPAEQFNIGNLQNLLQMALGGQAQAQSGALTAGANLGNRLAGLRGISTTGSSNTVQFAPNPFLRSFQESAGKSLGQTTTGGRSVSFGPAKIGGTN